MIAVFVGTLVDILYDVSSDVSRSVLAGFSDCREMFRYQVQLLIEIGAVLHAVAETARATTHLTYVSIADAADHLGYV